MSKNNLLSLISAWEIRHKKPLQAAKLVCEVLGSSNKSPHRLALSLGSRPAEVAAFRDLACLTEEAQKCFIKHRLPVTLALGLVDEEEEIQIEIIGKLCKSGKGPDKIIDEFQYLLYEAKYSRSEWRHILTGEHLKHISSKAKSYDVLSNKQRRALFDIGRRILLGEKLSTKQRRYIDYILGKCLQEQILNRSCSTDQCAVCGEIADIVEKGKNGTIKRRKGRSSA